MTKNNTDLKCIRKVLGEEEKGLQEVPCDNHNKRTFCQSCGEQLCARTDEGICVSPTSIKDFKCNCYKTLQQKLLSRGGKLCVA